MVSQLRSFLLARWKVVVVSLVILAVLSGIGFVMVSQFFSKTTSCPTVLPSDQDVEMIVALGKDVFEPELWQLSTAKHPALVSVLWRNSDNQALAHAELLLYNCGYNQVDLENYFSDKNFGFIFKGYESWKRTAQCESDGVTLHEFAVVCEGQDYQIRYWIKPINDIRVMDIQIGFFADDRALLDEYAARLFPDLAACK